jgi:hypothetical protein
MRPLAIPRYSATCYQNAVIELISLLSPSYAPFSLGSVFPALCDLGAKLRRGGERGKIDLDFKRSLFECECTSRFVFELFFAHPFSPSFSPPSHEARSFVTRLLRLEVVVNLACEEK